MRTVNTNIYQFNELNEQAQERALEYFIEYCDIDLLDNEIYKELLRENGFLDAKIEYSGFGSQGDGASFTADIDMNKFLVGKYAALKDTDFELKITFSHSRYCHERTKEVVGCFYHGTEAEGLLIDELVDEVEELRLELCREIYRMLEQEYDYRTSKEYFAEYAENNEYEFLENGDTYYN